MPIRIWAEFANQPGVSLGMGRQLIGTYTDQGDAELAMMEFEARNPGVSFEQELVEDEPEAGK
jgi:hypothetical protein